MVIDFILNYGTIFFHEYPDAASVNVTVNSINGEYAMAFFGGGRLNFDSPFYRIMTKIFDIVAVGCLWLVCCCGIITIGASTASLYYVMLKLARNEEGSIPRMFFHSFKENFKQSIPITLLEILFYFVVFFEVEMIKNTVDAVPYYSALYGICIAVILIGTGIFSWIYPYFSRFSDTVGGTLKKGAILAMAHLPRTLLMAGMKLIPLIWFEISPTTLVYSLWFWMFLGGGFISYLCSFFINPVFDRMMPKETDTTLSEEEEDRAYDDLKKTLEEERKERGRRTVESSDDCSGNEK